ncbi:hypothetical protein C4J85_1945 [Pseudomonas sp. R4-34-07]|nr:hypothetical protein C4J85_1945 [Pseudomonas sp. R4-34-07]
MYQLISSSVPMNTPRQDETQTALRMSLAISQSERGAPRATGDQPALMLAKFFQVPDQRLRRVVAQFSKWR